MRIHKVYKYIQSVQPCGQLHDTTDYTPARADVTKTKGVNEYVLRWRANVQRAPIGHFMTEWPARTSLCLAWSYNASGGQKFIGAETHTRTIGAPCFYVYGFMPVIVNPWSHTRRLLLHTAHTTVIKSTKEMTKNGRRHRRMLLWCEEHVCTL